MAAQATASSSLVIDLLFENARVGLCLVAPDDTVIRANAEWLRSTGHTAEDIVGQDVTGLFRTARDQMLALHARARAGYRVEIPRDEQTAAGQDTWWEGSIDPVPMEGGTGLLIIAREITDQVRTEDARRVEEQRVVRAPSDAGKPVVHDAAQRLQLILSSMKNGVLFVTDDGVAEFANSAFCDLFGLDDSPADLKGLRAAEVVAKIRDAHDDPGKAVARIQEIIARREPVTGEEIAMSRGRRFLRDYLPLTADEKPCGRLWVFSDITERKRVEEALRDSEERLRAAFAASPDAININRLRDGAYIAVNERFEQLSGWPRAEVMGRTVVDLNVWVDVGERDRLMALLVGSGSVHNAEAAFRRRDGTVFAASISAQMFEASGERFLLAITRDISDLKRAERALREADRRKDEFLGMLSHELRNPLAPIRNALYILAHAEPGGQQARRAEEIVRRQLAQITRLVDDLLDVTRITRGKIELRRTEVDLVSLIQRIAEDHRELMRNRGLELRLILPPAPVVVYADATRLAQVFGNLLHNSSKFTPSGGEVTITAGHEDGRAVVHVRDTGIGMEPETLSTIFEPFVQAKQNRARTEGGLGLGLALVKGLVTMHGGEVSARSEGAGRGTEFVIILPLDRRHAVRARPHVEDQRAHAARRHVLVVDDDQDAAETLAQVVQMIGHEVAVAHDGPSALAMAQPHAPDVVLCDLGLPGMDGYEVARRLRALSGSRVVLLVAVSGYAQPEDVAKAVEAGFDAHVAKPCDPAEIERLLAEGIEPVMAGAPQLGGEHR